ncbi:MAG: hypothetical protein ACRDGM_14725, partial [bacterium]
RRRRRTVRDGLPVPGVHAVGAPAMIERLAKQWFEQAQRDFPPQAPNQGLLWEALSDGEKEVVLQHVQRILNGEVPTSQMSEADKSVAIGRKRHVEDISEEHPRKRPSVYSRRWANWWDSLYGQSLPISNNHPILTGGGRLFDNRNIGNYFLCNLQVAGQLCGDQSAFIRHWYIRTTVHKENADGLEEAFQESYADFHVGQRRFQQATLIDLFLDAVRLDRIIPPRQNFDVTVNLTSKATRILNECLKTPLRFHLEGVERLEVL